MKSGKSVLRPAVFFYVDGNLHREDGPAAEYPSGIKKWYLNGDLHRDGGPAIEHVGGRFWYWHGVKHREDGPAIEWSDGTKEWFVYDTKLTEEEFNQWLEKKALNGRLHSHLPTRHVVSRGKI